MEASGRVIIAAIQSYFGAAIGLQRLPNPAVREPPPAGQEYAAHCYGDAAEGSLPILAALRRLPEEPTLDQSLLPNPLKMADKRSTYGNQVSFESYPINFYFGVRAYTLCSLCCKAQNVACPCGTQIETETGLLVTIRRSKTDQDGEGITIAITRGDVACPTRALREWLGAAGIDAGAIFRPINKAGTVSGERLTDRSVANIVKAHAERAGFDASLFSGHSLRSGFLTSAAAKGASIFKMMDVSRHKSVDTLRGYVRDAELFKDHAGAGLL